MSEKINIEFRIKWERWSNCDWCWHVYYRFTPNTKWTLKSLNYRLEKAYEVCRDYVEYCRLGRLLHHAQSYTPSENSMKPH